jgi:hypothetical protein
MKVKKLVKVMLMASAVIVGGTVLAAVSMMTHSSGYGRCQRCGYNGNLSKCKYCGYELCNERCWNDIMLHGDNTCPCCGRGNP